MYSWKWLAFDADTGQALSRLGLGAFALMLAVAALLLLSKPPKRLMKGLILCAFGLCIFVSFVASTLSIWHHYYR